MARHGITKKGDKWGRPTCWSCFRPTWQCLCGSIQPIQAHCNLLILQHPNERNKYHSSTKIVKQAFKNLKILHGVIFQEEQLRDLLSSQKTYLLFPGEGAQDCKTVHLDSSTTVIIIDGTWSEAGKIVYRNPYLQTLPKITFATDLRSNYRIRRQPKASYLSTLESIGYLLKLNASVSESGVDESKYNALFEDFDKMIQQQLSFWPPRAANFKSVK